MVSSNITTCSSPEGEGSFKKQMKWNVWTFIKRFKFVVCHHYTWGEWRDEGVKDKKEWWEEEMEAQK